MRPPDLPGGNDSDARGASNSSSMAVHASMRPPDLPGGNALAPAARSSLKLPISASMRPPDLPGGNSWQSAVTTDPEVKPAASMRPPDLPGGNVRSSYSKICRAPTCRFNEAAGFTRRKHRMPGSNVRRRQPEPEASMRPPDLPGGNPGKDADEAAHAGKPQRFNEAAGFTRRKPATTVSADLLYGSYLRRFNEAAGFTRRKHVGHALSPGISPRWKKLQ